MPKITVSARYFHTRFPISSDAGKNDCRASNLRAFVRPWTVPSVIMCTEIEKTDKCEPRSKCTLMRGTTEPLARLLSYYCCCVCCVVIKSILHACLLRSVSSGRWRISRGHRSAHQFLVFTFSYSTFLPRRFLLPLSQ